jgi:hypothetical protein
MMKKVMARKGVNMTNDIGRKGIVSTAGTVAAAENMARNTKNARTGAALDRIHTLHIQHHHQLHLDHIPDHGPGLLSAALDRAERRNLTINTEAGLESTVGAGAAVDRLLRNHPTFQMWRKLVQSWKGWNGDVGRDSRGVKYLHHISRFLH